MFDEQNQRLDGNKGVVLGIANHHSIAYGCAKAFRFLGADLALTYLNHKAKPYVDPIAEELETEILLPCDVQNEGDLATLFSTIRRQWGTLDFGPAFHCLCAERGPAWAPGGFIPGRIHYSDGYLLSLVYAHGKARRPL